MTKLLWLILSWIILLAPPVAWGHADNNQTAVKSGCIAALDAATNGLYKGLSQHWIEFLRLDQNYNIPGRDPLTKSQRVVEAMYVYEYSPDTEGISQHDTAAGPESLLASENGKIRVLSWKKLKGQTPITTYRRTMVQSRSTELVWDPAHPEREPIFFKPNSRDRSFKVSRILTAITEHKPPQHFDYMAEPIYVKVKGVNSYVVREAQPSQGFLAGKLFPSHGLFGEKAVIKQFAQKAGISEEVWMHRLVQKYALAIAEAQLSYGVVFPSHSQNTNFLIDPESGQIIKIVFKDLGDVSIDRPNMLYNDPQRANFLPNFEGSIFGRLNAQGLGVDEDEQKLHRNPGGNFLAYGSQTVEGAAVFESEPQLTYRFLRFYLTAVEQMTGINIDLAATTEELLARLVNSDDSSGFPEKIYWKYGGISAVCGVVLQEIYNIVSQARVRLPKNVPPYFDQGTLRDKFLDQNNALNIDWLVDVESVRLSKWWLSSKGIQFYWYQNVAYMADKDRRILATTNSPN